MYTFHTVITFMLVYHRKEMENRVVRSINIHLIHSYNSNNKHEISEHAIKDWKMGETAQHVQSVLVN